MWLAHVIFLKPILENKHTQKKPSNGLSNSNFFFFFKSCYSSSLDMESIVATPKQYSLLKKITGWIKNYSFSLIPSSFVFVSSEYSLSLSLSLSLSRFLSLKCL